MLYTELASFTKSNSVTIIINPKGDEKQMEIIGNKERLIGCDMKISGKSCGNAEDKYGEIFELVNVKELRITGGNTIFYDENYGVESSDLNIILNDKFIEKFKSEKMVVNCETEEEAEIFNKITKSAYKENTLWYVYKQDTCYSMYNFKSGSYDSIDNYKSEGFTIIKFKDCVIQKNEHEYRDNVSFNKDNLKPGDRVLLKDYNDNINEKYMSVFSDMLQYFGEILTVLDVGDKSFKGLGKDGDWMYFDLSWIDKKVSDGPINDIRQTKKNKTKYNVVTGLTIRDIQKALPCIECFTEFIKELLDDGYTANDILDNTIVLNEDVLKYKTVKENIDWCIEKGFIKEIKEFKPFTFNIDIDTPEKLYTLRNQFNVSEEYVRKSPSKYKDAPYDDSFMYYCFNLIDKEMYRIK